MTNDWASFEAETARQLEMWRTSLALWQLEVISTRCTWQMWPTETTRAMHVRAIAERERCQASLIALTSLRSVALGNAPESAQ